MKVLRFRSLFGVQRGHALDAVFSASRGAGPWRERWVHEEHDETGALLARYETWVGPADQTAAQTLAWRKMTPGGEACASAQRVDVSHDCDFDS